MAKTAYTGQRRCIICGKRAQKAELLRIVRSPSGVVSLDRTGCAPGRGAYVCSEKCFAFARKQRKLDRALKRVLDSDEYERIAADVAMAACEAGSKRDTSRGVVYGQHAST